MCRSLARAKTSAPSSEEGTSQQDKGQANMELITKPGVSVCPYVCEFVCLSCLSVCMCVCVCVCIHLCIHVCVRALCHGMCVCKIHDHNSIIIDIIPYELCYSVL